MEILGIGMPELFFIIIIALIVLGPRDMEKAGKTIGKWLRDIVTSDGWKVFQQASREMRTLPNRLMREANDELNKIGKDINGAVDPTRDRHGSWDTPADSKPIIPPFPIPTTPPANPAVDSSSADNAAEHKEDPETNA